MPGMSATPHYPGISVLPHPRRTSQLCSRCLDERAGRMVLLTRTCQAVSTEIHILRSTKMDEQNGAVDQQQMTPETLRQLMQQQPQQVRRNLAIGELGNLLPVLNEMEFIAFQAELQIVTNTWLRKKGLMV